MSRHAERPAPAAALSDWWRSSAQQHWVVEDEVAVAVGDRVWNADRERAEPAVTVQMPAHYARHLASVLDDWSSIARLLESSRGAEQRELAAALHEAARAAEALFAGEPEASAG
jgi:hypothetical protein